MLKQCFRHYGLCSPLSLAVERLALLCFYHHPCGYSSAPAKNFSFSRGKAAQFLGINENLLGEALHYGALFGLLQNVTLSPYHAEFALNPTHRRDLFFAKLRFQLRESAVSV